MGPTRPPFTILPPLRGGGGCVSYIHIQFFHLYEVGSVADILLQFFHLYEVVVGVFRTSIYNSFTSTRWGVFLPSVYNSSTSTRWGVSLTSIDNSSTSTRWGGISDIHRQFFHLYEVGVFLAAIYENSLKVMGYPWPFLVRRT